MEIAIIGGLLGIISALLGAILKRQFSPPKLEPNPHPEHTRSGELASSYWLREFDRLHEAIKESTNRIVEAIRGGEDDA